MFVFALAKYEKMRPIVILWYQLNINGGSVYNLTWVVETYPLVDSAKEKGFIRGRWSILPKDRNTLVLKVLKHGLVIQVLVPLDHTHSLLVGRCVPQEMVLVGVDMVVVWVWFRYILRMCWISMLSLNYVSCFATDCNLHNMYRLAGGDGIVGK